MPNMNMQNIPPIVAIDIFHRWLLMAAIALAVTFMIVLIISRVTRKPGVIANQPLGPIARQLQLGLGVLWFLDGLLQMQPLMVTRFIGGFLAPLLTGQPLGVSFLVRLGIQIWAINPIAWNVMATLIQVVIGLLLIFGGASTWARVGIWLSVIWGVVVWVAGEGLGAIFVGGGWLSGSPGSVILYVAAALLLLKPTTWWDGNQASKWIARAMAGIWGLDALLQLWPMSGWWSKNYLAGYVLSMAQMPQPQWISQPLYAWAKMLYGHPIMWNGALSAILLVLAIAWLIWPKSRVVFWTTGLWILLTWWLGQDFGVLGGMGTDPNSGAVMLLAWGVYGRLARVWRPLWNSEVGHSQFASR